MPKNLMIGQLAAATGTKVNTIRFYEDIGLMRTASRSAGGRRTYDEADLRRLRFIRHARDLGFDTAKVRSLMALADQPDGDCKAVNEIATRHLTEIDVKITRLISLRDELARVADICGGGTLATCRILDVLGSS